MELKTHAAIRRQPLFSNPHLFDTNGITWDQINPTSSRSWMNYGIHRVEDLWDASSHSWKPITTLPNSPYVQAFEIVKRNPELCTTTFVHTSLPECRRLEKIPSHGYTITCALCHQCEFYSMRGRHFFHLFFSLIGIEWMCMLDPNRICCLADIRVIQTKGPKSTMVPFNPPFPVSLGLHLWYYLKKLVTNLPFDPIDWEWKCCTNLPEAKKNSGAPHEGDT